MAREERMICDWCDKDLTYTDNSEAYFVELRPMAKRHRQEMQAVTDLSAYPWPKKMVCFCDEDCMRKWMDREQGSVVPVTLQKPLGGGSIGVTISGSTIRITTWGGDG